MYDTMKHHISWRHKADDMHSTVRGGRLSTPDGSQMKHKRKLQLFPAVGPLLFMAIDILGLLLRTASNYQHDVIVAYQYLKGIYAITTGRITSMRRAPILLESWILQ